MKSRFLAARQWLLTIASAGSLAVGVFSLQSCAGEGGAIGGGGGGGTDTSITREFQALFPTGQAGASYVGTNTCSQEACHGGQSSVHAEWLMTKHASANVGCESCHGPGSNHAASPSATNILGYDKVTASVVCAQCHGKIYDEWNFSQHSKLVDSPVVSATTSPATTRSSQCVACHGGLFKTKFQERGIGLETLTDPVIRATAESILGSTTAESPIRNTATCVTCHDPHKKTGKLSGDGKEVQLRRATFNTDTAPIAPGTTAATFTQYDHICAQCHNGRGANPSDAALNSGTARPNMHDSVQFNMLMGIGGYEGAGPVVRNTAHAQIPGQCSHCHMPDSNHNFKVQYDKSCAPCHSAADAAARMTSIKQTVVSSMYQLLSRLEAWSQITYGDPDLWNYTTFITAEGKTPPAQAGVPIQVKRARHNYWYVIRDMCYGGHNAPYTQHLIRVAGEELTALGVPGGKPTKEISYQEKLRILESQFARAKQLSGVEGH